MFCQMYLCFCYVNEKHGGSWLIDSYKKANINMKREMWVDLLHKERLRVKSVTTMRAVFRFAVGDKKSVFFCPGSVECAEKK